MGKFQSFIAFVVLCASSAKLAAAAIGPVTDLTISNADVSPDGGHRFTIAETFEVAGEAKPGCVADAILMFWDQSC